jgi:hypothetical protein
VKQLHRISFTGFCSRDLFPHTAAGRSVACKNGITSYQHSTSKPTAMKTKFTIALFLMNFIGGGLYAHQPPLVYPVENSGKTCPVPALPPPGQLPVIAPLPDPFMRSDGSSRSTSFNNWECRRNEIRSAIEHYEIGLKPEKPDTITASYANNTLTVTVTENGQTLVLTSQIVLPTGTGPFPAVIGMNSGTGSIPPDVFTTRNIATIRYNHNNVTTYNNPQLTDPYFKLYPGQDLDNAGQYSAWAWGVSRIIDGLELVKENLPIDLSHLGVTGCSYAGKMALFAGAFDERIALTIAQESGGGGAPSWRVSETIGNVEKLGATSHQWFKESMFAFAGPNVSKLPHDHHELMAMIAPRALLVTGNTDFLWLANPSCYVSARAAHEVWKTFGIGDRFGYYIDGGHGHCAIPATQRPAVEAFVDKFMLGKTAINTNIMVHPYPGIDYESWYKWWGTNKPVFPPDNSKKIWLEAECAAVGSSWDVLEDTAASKGRYIMGRPGLNSNTVAPAGDSSAVIFSFYADSAASYTFLARVNCADANDDSYWIRVDNGTFTTVNNLTTAGWQWVTLTTTPLTVGQHGFAIAYREDGARLDKILVTTSGFGINGIGAPGANCGAASISTPR